MELLRRFEETELVLCPDKAILLSNVLNEVCHGFALADFDGAMGAPKGQVRALFDRVTALDTERSVRLPVTKAELRILCNALRETLLELGTEEFSTRTGLDFETGAAVLSALQTHADNSG